MGFFSYSIFNLKNSDALSSNLQLFLYLKWQFYKLQGNAWHFLQTFLLSSLNTFSVTNTSLWHQTSYNSLLQIVWIQDEILFLLLFTTWNTWSCIKSLHYTACFPAAYRQPQNRCLEASLQGWRWGDRWDHRVGCHGENAAELRTSIRGCYHIDCLCLLPGTLSTSGTVR